jgi:hypothetical protein
MDMEKLLEISSSYMTTCLTSNYFLPHLFYTEAQIAQVCIVPWLSLSKNVVNLIY